MTTQAISKEEDLIILNDDNSSSDTSITYFDFSTQNKNMSTEQELPIVDFSSTLEENKDSVETGISFDENLFSMDTTEKIEGTTDITLKADKTDIFASNENVESTETTVETSAETKEIDFGFGEVAEEVQETNKADIPTSNENVGNDFSSTELGTSQIESFDRNAILDETISKMQSRKSSISQAKGDKQFKVDELNKQILFLKSQVSDLEVEIKDLEIEDSALDLDISSIEKMKLSVLEVTSDRQRKHNLSNIKK